MLLYRTKEFTEKHTGVELKKIFEEREIVRVSHLHGPITTAETIKDRDRSSPHPAIPD